MLNIAIEQKRYFLNCAKLLHKMEFNRRNIIIFPLIWRMYIYFFLLFPIFTIIARQFAIEIIINLSRRINLCFLWYGCYFYISISHIYICFILRKDEIKNNKMKKKKNWKILSSYKNFRWKHIILFSYYILFICWIIHCRAGAENIGKIRQNLYFSYFFFFAPLKMVFYMVIFFTQKSTG